ncbi:hypothetical protein MRB53_007654 [Persea americana]|uniref:Uncharacterized protein n=1 Tax=Persea americana TaxID=3435 RepID=A0ACC2MKG5_PERAE|nr:hypothetical protein MRB53_007654 [Persea americana]
MVRVGNGSDQESVLGDCNQQGLKLTKDRDDLCYVCGSPWRALSLKCFHGHFLCRELLDELPGKRKHEEASDYTDDSSLDDEDGLEVIMVFIDILSFPYATYLFSV